MDGFCYIPQSVGSYYSCIHQSNGYQCSFLCICSMIKTTHYLWLQVINQPWLCTLLNWVAAFKNMHRLYACSPYQNDDGSSFAVMYMLYWWIDPYNVLYDACSMHCMPCMHACMYCNNVQGAHVVDKSEEAHWPMRLTGLHRAPASKAKSDFRSCRMRGTSVRETGVALTCICDLPTEQPIPTREPGFGWPIPSWPKNMSRRP